MDDPAVIYTSTITLFRVFTCTYSEQCYCTREEDGTWLTHLVWVVVMQRRRKMGLSVGGLGEKEEEREEGEWIHPM